MELDTSQPIDTLVYETQPTHKEKQTDINKEQNSNEEMV